MSISEDAPLDLVSASSKLYPKLGDDCCDLMNFPSDCGVRPTHGDRCTDQAFGGSINLSQVFLDSLCDSDTSEDDGVPQTSDQRSVSDFDGPAKNGRAPSCFRFPSLPKSADSFSVPAQSSLGPRSRDGSSRGFSARGHPPVSPGTVVRGSFSVQPGFGSACVNQVEQSSVFSSSLHASAFHLGFGTAEQQFGPSTCFVPPALPPQVAESSMVVFPPPPQGPPPNVVVAPRASAVTQGSPRCPALHHGNAFVSVHQTEMPGSGLLRGDLPPYHSRVPHCSPDQHCVLQNGVSGSLANAYASQFQGQQQQFLRDSHPYGPSHFSTCSTVSPVGGALANHPSAALVYPPGANGGVVCANDFQDDGFDEIRNNVSLEIYFRRRKRGRPQKHFRLQSEFEMQKRFCSRRYSAGFSSALNTSRRIFHYSSGRMISLESSHLDSLGRVISLENSHDISGRLISLESSHDSLGRMISLENSHDSSGRMNSLENSHDSNGKMTSLQSCLDTSGSMISEDSSYNSRGRMISLGSSSDCSGGMISFKTNYESHPDPFSDSLLAIRSQISLMKPSCDLKESPQEILQTLASVANRSLEVCNSLDLSSKYSEGVAASYSDIGALDSPVVLPSLEDTIHSTPVRGNDSQDVVGDELASYDVLFASDDSSTMVSPADDPDCVLSLLSGNNSPSTSPTSNSVASVSQSASSALTSSCDTFNRTVILYRTPPEDLNLSDIKETSESNHVPLNSTESTNPGTDASSLESLFDPETSEHVVDSSHCNSNSVISMPEISLSGDYQSGKGLSSPTNLVTSAPQLLDKQLWDFTSTLGFDLEGSNALVIDEERPAQNDFSAKTLRDVSQQMSTARSANDDVFPTDELKQTPKSSMDTAWCNGELRRSPRDISGVSSHNELNQNPLSLTDIPCASELKRRPRNSSDKTPFSERKQSPRKLEPSNDHNELSPGNLMDIPSYLVQRAFDEGRYGDVFQIIRENAFPDEQKPRLRRIWSKALVCSYSRVTSLPITPLQRTIIVRQNPLPDSIKDREGDGEPFEIITVE